MSLSSQLSTQLQSIIGFAGPDPRTICAADGTRVVLELDATAVERMGCSFRELRLSVPSLSGAELPVLETWAHALCRRVTYLLESIGPLELDPEHGEVLIRSTPPDKQSGGTWFYEILLSSHGNGHFSLRRYRSLTGQPGREQVEIQTTYEVLTKLVNDLDASIPQ